MLRPIRPPAGTPALLSGRAAVFSLLRMGARAALRIRAPRLHGSHPARREARARGRRKDCGGLGRTSQTEP
eukprot:COSAG02_NODE_7621_length_2930_cov_15.463519_1_plen_70_part_10